MQIFDDPLSALDAHVGKAVFQNVLQNSSTGKTRILVTHALHFLPQVDYIYAIVDGKIAERGTYEDLLANDGAFSKFQKEFGSKETEAEKKEDEEDAIEAPVDNEEDAADRQTKARKKVSAGAGMMQKEERNTGAISGEVYKTYVKAARGEVVIPMLIMALALMQGATVMSSYWSVNCSLFR